VRDPRRPAIPIEMEEDPEPVLVSSDGRLREHYNLIYTADDAERIRLGYCCIHCGESQVGHGGKPFPEECAVCHYPMNSQQRERFAQEFIGNVRLGPSTSIEEELEIAEQMVRGERTTKSGIIVPRGIV
jgi:hypothetical protein